MLRPGRGTHLVGRWVGDAEAIDRERGRVDERVEQEALAADELPDGPRGHDPDAEPGQGRSLETGGRATAEQLVAGRGQGDEAEDRWHRRSRRGTFEQASCADDR